MESLWHKADTWFYQFQRREPLHLPKEHDMTMLGIKLQGPGGFLRLKSLETVMVQLFTAANWNRGRQAWHVTCEGDGGHSEGDLRWLAQEGFTAAAKDDHQGRPLRRLLWQQHPWAEAEQREGSREDQSGYFNSPGRWRSEQTVRDQAGKETGRRNTCLQDTIKPSWDRHFLSTY